MNLVPQIILLDLLLLIHTGYAHSFVLVATRHQYHWLPAVELPERLLGLIKHFDLLLCLNVLVKLYLLHRSIVVVELIELDSFLEINDKPQFNSAVFVAGGEKLLLAHVDWLAYSPCCNYFLRWNGNLLSVQFEFGGINQYEILIVIVDLMQQYHPN